MKVSPFFSIPFFSKGMERLDIRIPAKKTSGLRPEVITMFPFNGSVNYLIIRMS
jgi:hypothetical protein